MPGGAEAQIGWASESTVGTGVAVTKFLPFRSENIKQNIEYMDTQTLSSRLVLRKTFPGRKSVEGGFTTELPNITIATMLRHMMGTAAAPSGAGPYTHSFTPGATTGIGLTVQVGRPDSTGTVQPFTYAGMKVSEWTIAASVGEIATLEVNFVGMTETTGTALATQSIASTWSPFVFTQAALTLGGSASNNVREFSLTGNNQIEPRHRLGSATSKNPLGIGVREYTGTVVTDFDALTDYNRFVTGAEAALVATFTSGTDVLTITQNVMFVGETPEVSGNELLAQTLPYRAVSSTSDAAGITIALVIGDSVTT